ncbi:MAG: transporter substrate-binding domain-containing protein [Myxococcota bacterium]
MPFRTRTILLAGVLLAGVPQLSASEPVLRVGTSGDYRPFSENTPGGYRGFDIAVAERFARDTGVAVAWVPFRWPELLEAMKAGRFDVAMSGVTIRPERSIRGRFTVPVVETGAVLLVRGATWRRLEVAPAQALERLDEADVLLAVNAGGHLERVTRAHFPSARIRAIPDNRAVRQALAAGEVDAIVSDTLEAPGWLQGLTDVRLVGPFTRDHKAYWVRADDAALATRLDAWLMARERDGSLAALRAEWFGDASLRRTATPLEALLAACDERLALMASVAEYKRARGVAVVDPEREARVLAAAWQAVTEAAEQAGGEPPPRVDVDRFYRAQIAAAVAIQHRILAGPMPPGTAVFDLAQEIRPALLRIGERMASLLLLTARDSEPRRSDLHGRVEEALARHRLPAAQTRGIAEAIARLSR